MADNIFQGISAGPDPQPGAPGYYDRIPFRKWKDPPPRPTSKALVLVYHPLGHRVGDQWARTEVVRLPTVTPRHPEPNRGAR